MKVLVINGSPKGERSNTLKLTKAFLEGIGEAEVKEINLSSYHIKGCKGCFCCWNKTPGKCVINDDMSKVIDLELWAEVIIWSFPLYYFNVPGGLKNLIDRQLPMNLPFMVDKEEGNGSGSHPARYDMSKVRHVLISTCGFYSAKNNYDSVKAMFDHFLGKDSYELITCGQGELFRVKELSSRTDEYLEIVKEAGKEFLKGKISQDTYNRLEELLYPKDVFEEMADASWGISKEEKKVDETLIFTRQMAALYNKNSYDGVDKVLEITYTDRGKTYQILLTKDGSHLYEGGELTPTTKIETPFEVWTSIAKGEIRGDQALMKGLYKVNGDFNLMIHWDDYFTNQTKKKVTNKLENKKKPLMIFLLIPWMVFWIAVSINEDIGPIIALCVNALIPLISFRHKITIYDVVSVAAVGILSSLTLILHHSDIFIIIGYLSFGLLWLVSCLTKEPLCAAYVKYNYNGDDALNNPIFMKTNYILAIGWGVLYVILSVVTFFLYKYNLQLVSIILNNASPILMGIFTWLFEKYYPARVASGKGRKRKNNI